MSQKRPILLLSVLLRTGNFIRQVRGVLDFLRMYAGWRIDYFLVSNRAASQIREANIRSEILGSDHCPVELVLD